MKTSSVYQTFRLQFVKLQILGLFIYFSGRRSAAVYDFANDCTRDCCRFKCRSVNFFFFYRFETRYSTALRYATQHTCVCVCVSQKLSIMAYSHFYFDFVTVNFTTNQVSVSQHDAKRILFYMNTTQTKHDKSKKNIFVLLYHQRELV